MGATVLALGGLALLAGRTPSLPRLPASRPARAPQEAKARLAALEASEPAGILPICRGRVWDHRRCTQSVVVLLHGYTNCPHQVDQLGALLFGDGHTVFAPRLPFHGQVNRIPTNLDAMTLPVLANWLAEVLDIAHGFGEDVHVLGFSLGGALAAWAAQERHDLAHVVLASPALGIRAIPRYQRRLLANLLPALPDRFIWWDPVRRANKLGPPQMYVGISQRGIGVLLALGRAMLTAAARRALHTARITLALNPSDTVVDNREATHLAEAWLRHGADVRLFHFRQEPPLIHDLLDPLQPAAQTERVYPVLRSLIAGAHPSTVRDVAGVHGPAQ